MAPPIQPVFEVDSGDDQSSSGTTIYHDESINQPASNLQAPFDLAMLRRMEDKWDNHRLANIVRTSAQQVKQLTNEEDKRAREQSDEIDIILEELGRVKTITARFAENITLKPTLDVLRLPEHKMSAVTNKTAQKLFQEFERQNWGEAIPVTKSTTTSQTKTSASARTRASRRQMALNESSGLATPAPVMEMPSPSLSGSTRRAVKDVKEIVHFEEDHPVFGNSGVMRGINIRLNKTRKITSYFLDKSQKRKRADVIGHNGLTVGDCWPYMICLVRDGVHGSPQGGIYGTEVSGAYSVVALGNSAYGEMDKDSGSILFYSGSGSLENTDPDHAKETQGTKALQTSALKKQAVRVIRGKNKDRKASPKAGFRYDGLYKVVAQKELKNGKGGAFIQFELHRMEDQAPIETSRPDTEEQKAFQDIKSVDY